MELARRQFFVFFIIAALLSACTPWAVFEKNVTFAVTDLEGMPVQNALISGTYQYKSASSESDGEFSIRTGRDGQASISVINWVPQWAEKKDFAWSVSGFGYAGKQNKAILDTNTTETLVIEEKFPISQKTVQVKAVDFVGEPLEGAILRMSKPYDSQTLTDENGYGNFTVPWYSNITAFAEYEGYTESAETGGIELEIRIYNYNTDIYAIIQDSAGRPIPKANVSAYYNGNWTENLVTDINGTAIIKGVKSKSAAVFAYAKQQEVNKTVLLDNYTVTAILEIQSMINVDLIVKADEQGDCAILTASIFDSRTSNSTAVGLIEEDGEVKNFALSKSSGGIWTGGVCPKKESKIGVMATNEYETSEFYYNETFKPKIKIEEPKPNVTVPDVTVPEEEKPVEPAKKIEWEKLVSLPQEIVLNIHLIVGVGSLVLLLLLILVFRRQIGFYVYCIVKLLRRTRGKDRL